MKHKQNDEAAAAWLKAREAGADALLWLMRAARLAPEDPRIALELAQAQLSQGDAATASDGFARLAKRYDIAAAWMGLAVASAQSGDMAQAAQALEAMLTRHCLPDDPSFAAFAVHTATASNHRGFQGVAADGGVIRHGRPKFLGAKPDWAALTRVEGLVAWDKLGLTGWAARPAAPEAPPELWLHDAAGVTRRIEFGKPLPPDDTAPFCPATAFDSVLRSCAA